MTITNKTKKAKKSKEQIEHTRRRNRAKNDEEPPSYNYLDIWEQIPSFKDINYKWGLLKLATFIITAATLMIATFLILTNIALAIIFPVIIGGFAVFTFREHIFFLTSIGKKNYGKIEPFEHLKFWYPNDNSDTLCMSNTQDLLNTGIRIFRISVIPENIQPNLNKFIHSLHVKGVGFTYQVVQAPMVQQTSEATKIDIYFALSIKFRGILTEGKFQDIRNSLEVYETDFWNAVVANLAHFQVEKLKGNKLINAFRSVFCRLPQLTDTSQNTPKSIIDHISILKVLVLVSFILYSDITFIILLPNYWYYIFLINIAIIVVFVFFFWRSLLYQFSRNALLNSEITEVNPFTDLMFYRFPAYKDILFIHSSSKMLSAVSFFNISEAFPQQFIAKDRFLARLDKFFRANVSTQLPFTYTVIASPLDYATFERGAKKYLAERTTMNLYFMEHEYERTEWMDMRNGIWRTMMLFSVSANQLCNEINETILTDLGETLQVKSKVFASDFKANFSNYQIQPLSKRETETALMTTLLKSKFFRLNGTHLKYQLFQGKTLMNLIEISHDFKKSIETRVAAEFNTPLNLTNFISIGNTLNTEFLGEEVPAGFTQEQIRRLLITNGTFTQRQKLLMKMVIELVKKDIPSIIFDYNGDFSKVIRYFQDTRFEENFLHFKLGENFRIDPFGTDIPYDKNTHIYISLLVDMLALVYKKRKQGMDQLKKRLTAEDFSLQDLAMEQQTQNRWEQDTSLEEVINELDFLRENPQIITNRNIEEGVEGLVLPNQFIQNDKTIIIDLTILPDLEPMVFISFIIMIKIQYFMLKVMGRAHPPEIFPKYFILPNIDIAFDNHFLDRRTDFNYSMINKFLQPIYNLNLGLIATANQIHNLHPNTLNYTENLITFKAFDKRDIAALKNLMNLQELHGSGYYTNKRKESYQIEFLKGMKPNEIIIKRTDINQPFPAITDHSPISKLEPLSKAEIVTYMQEQGFNLQDTENQILSDARKTLFEQHFGVYYKFLDEVIKFFSILQRLDNIGNLYKAKIKEELLHILSPKAKAKVGNDKKRIKIIRDQIFEIMLKHGYIIEAHPRKASGSQSIRPSYAIGPQYQASIDDYYEVNKEKPTKVSLDVISQESAASDSFDSFESLFQDNEKDLESELELKLEPFDPSLETPPPKPIPKKEIIEITINHTGQLFARLAKINRHIERKEYEDALFNEQTAVRRLVVNIYEDCHPNVSIDSSEEQLSRALEFFVDGLNLSMTEEYLNSLIHLSEDEDITRSTIARVLKENLQKLLEFSHKLRDEIEIVAGGEY